MRHRASFKEVPRKFSGAGIVAMTRLLVLGAGGHGRVVADSAGRMGVWGCVAFLDDGGGDSVIGRCDDLEQLVQEGDACVIAIGDNARRMTMLKKVKDLGVPVATVVDPSAAVSDGAVLGKGTVVLPRAAVNTGAKLGSGCIVNTGATVDHDCVLGDGVHVSPGAHLGGDVSVGEGTWIGLGASIRHGACIGERAMIGAGAAVVADVASDTTVVGVPARPITKKDGGP